MIIKNGLVFTEQFTFEPLHILTEGEYITSLAEGLSHMSSDSSGVAASQSDSSPLTGNTVFDATGCYVLPGLTDIHFHGCNGYDFCEGTDTAFTEITSFEFTKGVTSVCPATMTLPYEELEQICATASNFQNSQAKGKTSPATADLIGIHLEGPFINPNKKGAQNTSYIKPPSATFLQKLQKSANGLIKLVSLAPELPGAISCIDACKTDFYFSVAHTDADYNTAMAAFRAGANHLTHLYNAMPPFTHRAPGVIGAAFDSKDCFVELICDGVHSSPTAARAAFALFGDERMVLISDSMEACGKPDGTYQLGGLTVEVNGIRATLSDGTLAGSVTPLYECMKTAVSMGIPLASAVRAATINPCRSIGMDALYGSITPGKKAHFLILDQKDLSIKAVIKGNQIFSGQI